MEFLVRALRNPARRYGALWFTANSIGDCPEIAFHILQNLTVNFTDILYDVMSQSTVRKKQIEVVMWNLNNLLRLKIDIGSNGKDHLVNYMIRAAISVDDPDIYCEALMNLQYLTEMSCDNFKRILYNNQLIERILQLLHQASSRYESYQSLVIMAVMRCLGEFVSTCNITEQLQTFFNLNGLEKLNNLL